MSVLDPDVRRKAALSVRLFVAAVGLVALGGTSLQIQAQAPAQSAVAPASSTPNVTIDVASIKRNKQAEDEYAQLPPNFPAVPGRAQTLRGGLLRGRGMTAKELIRDAYGYRNRARSEVVGGPDWLDKERYDVEAKASQEFPASTSMGLPAVGEAALRALLAERLSLKVHVESQRRPVYELVMHRADRRLGPNLVPSARQCRPFFQREAVNVGLVIDNPNGADQPQPLPPCLLGVGPVQIVAQNMTMTDWVRILGLRPQLNRTVIDRTGLTGGFEITLTLIDPALGDPATANPLPAIKPLLESQLGLTLRDAEAPVDVLVIDHVDHPSEN